MNIGPMLNAYPDSMGGTLDDIAAFLQKPEMKDVFSSCYVLPSLFHTDLDRGFSVIDYSLNKMLASREALDKLEGLGIDLKLDFILILDTHLNPACGQMHMGRVFFCRKNACDVGNIWYIIHAKSLSYAKI